MERDNYRHGFDPEVWEQAKTEAKEAMRKRARRRQTLAYSDLVGEIMAIRFDPHESRLAHFLGEIAREEHEAGRGMLTVVVMHKGGSSPGRGFFEMARKLGYNFRKDDDFLVEQLNLVFEAHGPKE